MLRKWAGKWKKQILCILAGLALGGLAFYMEQAGSQVGQGYLERMGYGEEGKTYEFLVEGIWAEAVACEVEISPMAYSREEAETVFAELLEELPQMILGDNLSLEEVRSDLDLMTLFDGKGVRAVWRSGDPEVLDSFGRIRAENIPKEGIRTWLDVTLTDGIREKDGRFEVRVCPPLWGQKEQLAWALEEQIRQADMAYPENPYVELPREYEGKQIRYKDIPNRDYLILPVLGVILAALFSGQEKAREEKKRKERGQLLLLDYADVVYQLMVYLGAGLTVEKAWEQMVKNYEKRQKRGSDTPRPAYEEMALTLGQIQYGVPEGTALNQFGKRCQLQCYMRLSSLLEQNRKTGTKNLNQLLEQEMTTAWEEQKHTARRMGEEAKTKLLAPLFLMLAVVMVIIMVPAMMVMK